MDMKYGEQPIPFSESAISAIAQSPLNEQKDVTQAPPQLSPSQPARQDHQKLSTHPSKRRPVKSTDQ